MNENELYLVRKYRCDNPNITEVDSINDNCSERCHDKYFHKFNYKSIHHINFTNITINEIINMTISGKSMNLYDLNKKLEAGRKNGFIFNQKNKLTTKFYSHLRYINIGFYLKFQLPMCHRCFAE